MSRDGLKLRLLEHRESVRGLDWISPAGILVAVALTLASADFHKFAGQSGDFWKAMFSFIGIACACRLAWVAIKIAQRKPMDLDALVEKCIREGH